MTEITVSWSLYNGGKGWLARITGTDPKFGFAREFVHSSDLSSSRSGSTGRTSWLVDDGLYELNGRGGRGYVAVEGGKERAITRAQLLAALR